MTLIFRAEAADDIVGASAWYGEQRAGLGDEFLASLEHVLDLVERLPLSFPVVRSDTRRALLSRFPYALYFRMRDAGTIEIVACLHTRRSPHILRSRPSPEA